MNDVLVRAGDLIGHPVVSLDGELRGEVKDVVLGLREGVLVGFTLRNPGMLGGPRHETLLWEKVHAVGADAVMVADGEAATADDSVDLDEAHATVDLPLVTDDGQRLGQIVDVIVETGCPAQVVGFEVEPSEAMPSNAGRVLVPIDAMAAASEEAVVVPSGTRRFVHDELAGFGAAVAGFRSQGGNDEGT